MAWVSLDNLSRFYTKLKEKVYLKSEVDTKISELNSNIDRKLPFQLAIDDNGNYGYIKAGADSVTPFKQCISAYGVGTVDKTVSCPAGTYRVIGFCANYSSTSVLPSLDVYINGTLKASRTNYHTSTHNNVDTSSGYINYGFTLTETSDVRIYCGGGGYSMGGSIALFREE